MKMKNALFVAVVALATGWVVWHVAYYAFVGFVILTVHAAGLLK